MDTAEESLAYDQMDHSEVNRLFAADFLRALQMANLPLDVEVLDLGTGTAQIPIELCRQCETIRVTAIDLSSEMLRLAAENIRRAGLSSRITLERVDAKRLPFADGSFAAVMSNSIVHHIPEPQTTLGDAVRVVHRPGGLLFVRDLARPLDDQQVQHLVGEYASDCNDHQRKLFDDSLRAALSLEEIRRLVKSLGFEPESVQASSDRHWTWQAVTA